MHLTPIQSLTSSTYTSSDIYDIAKICQSAIFSNDLAILRYGKTTPEEQIPWLIEEATIELQDLEKPPISTSDQDGLGRNIDRHEHLVIRDLDLEPFTPPTPELEAEQHQQPNGATKPHDVDASHRGRIVGHAMWSYYTADSLERNEAANQPQPPISPTLPTSANAELVHMFNDLVNDTVKFHTRGRACYSLNEISTLSPSHLRKGIARQLVMWIVPYAERDQVPVIFAASPMGVPLYKACGWEEIGGERGVAEVDMGKWGGEGVHRHIMMIRYPNGAKGVGEALRG